MRTLVSRYKHAVHHWEVWNEPDNNLFWKPAPNPREYADLLKTAYKAIKEADPSALVLSGGVSGNAVPYLDAVVAAGGRDAFDILAIHPYAVPLNAEQARVESRPEVHKILEVELTKYRAFLQRHGLARVAHRALRERKERRGLVAGHPRDGAHGPGVARDVRAGQHGGHARLGARRLDIDLEDARVGVWAADDCRMEHAGELEVVEVPALAAEEAGVLDAVQALAEPATRPVAGCRVGGDLGGVRILLGDAHGTPPAAARIESTMCW